MQNKRDMISGIFISLVGFAVIIWGFRLEVGTLTTPLAGFFPLIVGCGMVGLSAILTLMGWLGRSGRPQAFGKLQKPAIMIAALAIYTVLLDPLGYILSTIFIAAVTLRILGVTSWKVISISSLTLSVSVYFLFTKFLSVELPAGVLTFLG
jgi:putative tricarboxylic transport membrane protein